MNWCQEHWGYLQQVIALKGMDLLVGSGASDAVAAIREERFDPLIQCWAAINSYMLRSPGLAGRILTCPLCILVHDGQPEYVKSWVDGCTSDCRDEVARRGLIDQGAVVDVSIPEPPTTIGTMRGDPTCKDDLQVQEEK